MAAVSQTITPTATVQYFGRFNADTDQPRGRVIFSDKTTITAKIAGDTKKLDINITLPRNFAYACDQFFLTLYDTTADVGHYNTIGVQTLQYTDPNTVNDVFAALKSPGLSGFSDAPGSMATWVVDKCFSEVFYSRNNEGVAIKNSLFDNDGVNASAQMTLNTYASYLFYDINQVNDVNVNAPTPVSIRG